jgi:hypothetical protein
MKGRQEIVSYHKALLEKNYNGSRSFMDSVTIRFLQPDVAIAHVATGATYIANGVEQKRTGLGTATMVKTNGKWLIAAFHNTLTLGLGYTFSPAPASEQTSAEPGHHLVACPDSPTSGKRPVGADCAIVAHRTFAALPKEPVVLRVENFVSTQAAQNSATPAGAVVETAGKIWLLTVASQGERSKSGTFVTEIGPISGIPTATNYEIQVADADFGPEMNPAISKAVHTHSGLEIWYLLSGEQCPETPSGAHRAKAGEGMFAPGRSSNAAKHNRNRKTRSSFCYRPRCLTTCNHRIGVATEGSLPEIGFSILMDPVRIAENALQSRNRFGLAEDLDEHIIAITG